MADFNCYIDESGDDGVGGAGSDWFVLTGLIVPASRDLALSRVVDRIKDRLRRAGILHWRKLKHAQKRVVVQELEREDFVCCNVAVDTRHPNIVKVPGLTGQKLYFYSVRYLVERVSWFCDDQGGSVSLIFENRAGLGYADLERYLSDIQNDPDCRIRRDCVRRVRPVPKGQLKLLQFADCLSGALFNALHIDDYGNFEQSYFLKVHPKLYRRGGNLFSYGLKFMPYDRRDIPGCLVDPYGWLAEI